jgi:hypothetical protein
LFVKTELLLHSVIMTEYSRELLQPVETKWHGSVSDLIILLNGASVSPQMADGG